MPNWAAQQQIDDLIASLEGLSDRRRWIDLATLVAREIERRAAGAFRHPPRHDRLVELGDTVDHKRIGSSTARRARLLLVAGSRGSHPVGSRPARGPRRHGGPV